VDVEFIHAWLFCNKCLDSEQLEISGYLWQRACYFLLLILYQCFTPYITVWVAVLFLSDVASRDVGLIDLLATHT